VTLDQLLDGVNIVQGAGVNPDTSRISRVAGAVGPGTLFFACRLPRESRPRDVQEAAGLRAAAIVLDEDDPRRGVAGAVPVVVVRRVNQAYSTACANFFGNAHRHLRCYAVTGTKGKTTTSHLADSILKSAGLRTGLITSLVRRVGRREMVSDLTTPDACELHGLLRRMHAAGVTDVVIEASSIGLAEDRLHGIRFEGVLLTNLGTDHFEYHGGAAEYRAVKRRLFTDAAFHSRGRLLSVLNADDPFGRELAGETRGSVVTYGIDRGDVRATDVELTSAGIRATAAGVRFESPLIGRHNLYNIVAAAALTGAVLKSSGAIARGIAAVRGLPGRLEPVTVPLPPGVDVLVDYAHTPESVQAVMTAAQSLARGRRIVVVLGCRGGGDRDKRSPMAKIAIGHADACILTSNNPNVEDPHAIVRDMIADLPAAELARSGRLHVVIDRREAIFRAVHEAAPDGLVLVLGRGSQATQIVGRYETPFDDREVARDAMTALCRLRES
jgi:UDP-N-acetylmuramoyl-L-alanyl-D-glutamate--2,6-diaminopimelate ligase